MFRSHIFSSTAVLFDWTGLHIKKKLLEILRSSHTLHVMEIHKPIQGSEIQAACVFEQWTFPKPKNLGENSIRLSETLQQSQAIILLKSRLWCILAQIQQETKTLPHKKIQQIKTTNKQKKLDRSELAEFNVFNLDD